MPALSVLEIEEALKVFAASLDELFPAAQGR